MHLDSPLVRYVPDYPNREFAGQATVRMLLSHTSGLGSYWNALYQERRATLVTVWFSLNSLLTAAFLLDGRLQPALPQVLAYAPLLLLGLWLGERLHRRFDERHFRLAIYCLLLVTGVLLLAPWSLA